MPVRLLEIIWRQLRKVCTHCGQWTYAFPPFNSPLLDGWYLLSSLRIARECTLVHPFPGSLHPLSVRTPALRSVTKLAPGFEDSNRRSQAPFQGPVKFFHPHSDQFAAITICGIVPVIQLSLTRPTGLPRGHGGSPGLSEERSCGRPSGVLSLSGLTQAAGRHIATSGATGLSDKLRAQENSRTVRHMRQLVPGMVPTTSQDAKVPANPCGKLTWYPTRSWDFGREADSLIWAGTYLVPAT